MKIELFHARFENPPEHVATLDNAEGPIMSALDRVYRSTQAVHAPWVAQKGQFGLAIEPTPAVLERGGCRSTTVGDYALVHMDGQVVRFECMPVGWKPVFPINPALAKP